MIGRKSFRPFIMRRILAVIALSFIFLPSFVLAQTEGGAATLTPENSGLEATGETIYGTNTSLSNYLGTYILVPAFSIVGLVFMVLFTYAGFLYLTAAGATAPIEKAKKIMQTAVIGIVLISTSYVITISVLNALSTGNITTGAGAPAEI